MKKGTIVISEDNQLLKLLGVPYAFGVYGDYDSFDGSDLEEIEKIKEYLFHNIADDFAPPIGVSIHHLSLENIESIFYLTHALKYKIGPNDEERECYLKVVAFIHGSLGNSIIPASTRARFDIIDLNDPLYQPLIEKARERDQIVSALDQITKENESKQPVLAPGKEKESSFEVQEKSKTGNR
ncbi:MAG: hypothetical protein HWE07_13340 [Cytophagia bacterium]|nr:hypothetical protein [Cytophagia bacterium]